MPAVAVTATITEPGRSRDNPVAATFTSRRLLNKKGSEKETWHIDFDLAASGLDYVVGDSFGVFARNDLGLVDQIIALLGGKEEERDGIDRTFANVLRRWATLGG